MNDVYNTHMDIQAIYSPWESESFLLCSELNILNNVCKKPINTKKELFSTNIFQFSRFSHLSIFPSSNKDEFRIFVLGFIDYLFILTLYQMTVYLNYVHLLSLFPLHFGNTMYI